jgi:MFS family permease
MGPVIGPPLGGFITTVFSWRWIFWINIPVGLLGIYLATRFIENFKEENVPPLDVKGFFLSGIGLAGLAFGFTIAGQPLFPGWFVASLLAVGTLSCILYVRHALKIPAPLLDLRLLKIPTFFANIAGGFLFRIGVGATPFLLPLYFQLGFGMTPLESGLLTFAIAVGAVVMKTTAAPILRQFGYRPILVWNALIAASFIMVCALFTKATPQVVILATLLLGGFFRSLEFTAINTIAYADIDECEMSKATSFASVSQQISISAGVAVGALVLEMQRAGRADHEVLASDFTMAFLIVGAICASSALIFMRLPKDAGASLSRRAHELGEPDKQPELRPED